MADFEQLEIMRMQRRIALFAGNALTGLIAHDGAPDNENDRQLQVDMAIRIGREMAVRVGEVVMGEEHEEEAQE